MKRPKDITFKKTGCDCVVTHTRIIKPCPPCEAEINAIRQRWAQEHKARLLAADPAVLA